MRTILNVEINGMLSGEKGGKNIHKKASLQKIISLDFLPTKGLTIHLLENHNLRHSICSVVLNVMLDIFGETHLFVHLMENWSYDERDELSWEDYVNLFKKEGWIVCN